MTGQDIQDRLDALVVDLQTVGKGQTINILMRDSNNAPSIFPLSSTAAGIVNGAQLSAIQAFINPLKVIANDNVAATTPVSTASESFKTASAPHESLRTSAQTATAALKTALDGDAAYQSAKTALESARLDAAYVSSTQSYRQNNVSENFAELQNAKGAYVV